MRSCLIIFLIYLPLGVHAADTCSRVAMINYQEVLVDAGSNRKGEGLRFFLEKDPVAKQYLDTYQENNDSFLLNATLGTVGSGLIIAGIFKPSDAGDSRARTALITSGAALLALNFLFSSTNAHSNESNLERAIDEYNKRNLPRIFFSPFQNNEEKGKKSTGLIGGLSQEF